MRLDKLLALSLTIILVSACTQSSSEKIPTSSDKSYASDSLMFDSTDLKLPGIERTVFNENSDLSSQKIPINCGNETTGYTYREQTKALSLDSFNYIEYNLNIPVAKVGSSAYPFAYTGGDVKSGDGALDAGIGVNAGGLPTFNGQILWSPFFNYTDKNLKGLAENVPAGVKYGLVGNQKISIKVWISPADYRIRMSVTGSFAEIDAKTGKPTSRTPNPFVTTRQYHLGEANQTTLWTKGQTVAYKLMTTVAVTNSYGYTMNDSADGISVQGFSYDDNSIKLGKIDAKNVVTGRTAWSSLMAPSTSTLANPCASPSDAVIPSGGHSATINVRVKSKYDFSFVNPVTPKGKTGDVVVNSFVVKNLGPAGSVLYYDFTPLNQPRQRGKLTSGQTVTGNPKYTCTSKSEIVTQPLDIYYSENETLTDGTKPSDLPMPPANLSSYSAIVGNLAFKKTTYKIPFRCNNLQSFQINSTDLYALINQAVSALATLNVVTDSAAPTGQYLVSQKTSTGSTPTATLTPQSIVVTAKIDSVTPVSATDFQAKQLPVNVQNAKCGNSPGNYPFTYTITDPTGKTDATDYTVTLHCFGPTMTVPTPNPLSISADVGSSASGSFSFQNNADATPSGERAPLNYTVSGSGGLIVSSTVSPLAGGSIATVTASYACTTAGSFQDVATINTDDVKMPSTDVTVNVTCNPTAPIIGTIAPNPLVISLGVGKSGSQQVKFKNLGGQALSYNVTDGQIDYTDYTTHTFYIDKRSYGQSVAPGAEEVITVSASCPMRRGTTSGTMTINSNDPKQPQIQIPMILNCTLGPAPIPVWVSGNGRPSNAQEMIDWSTAACNTPAFATAEGVDRALAVGNNYTYRVGARSTSADYGYGGPYMAKGYYVTTVDEDNRTVFSPDRYFGRATAYWQQFAADCNSESVTFMFELG